MFGGTPAVKALLIILAITFFGCATVHKPEDLSSLEPLKVIRFDTAEFRYQRLGKYVLSPLFWICPECVSDAVAKDEGRTLREKCALPDYGQLVMDKFTERVAREIPVWPRMVIETTPVKMVTLPWPILEGSPPAPKYEYKSSNILSFEVEYIYLVHAALTGHDTLWAITVAEMHSPDGELIWKKRYGYSQKNVEATDCKLVKDGFDEAAKKTIGEFIDYIKRIYHLR